MRSRACRLRAQHRHDAGDPASWTSFLIRVYAWIGILKPNGLLNDALMALRLIDAPLQISNTPTAVYIGIVYCYLPFMVLPLYTTWSSTTSACWKRPTTSAPGHGRRSYRSPCRCPRPASSPAACGDDPGGGRVRDPRAAGRAGHADDRPGAVERVLQQPRLAHRLGRGHRDAGPAAGADLVFNRVQQRQIEDRLP
jgi:hypothetical protein